MPNTEAPLPLAEACLRNQAPIAEVLAELLTTSQNVLEIGSGTGQHAVYIAEHLPHLTWQPTELAERVKEVEAWRLDKKLPNVLETKTLDVLQENWALGKKYDSVFSANIVHFVSWQKVEALVKGASEHLNKDGLFIVYGPYNKDQQFTSEGNKNLDAWLKQRDPESGIKDREEFAMLAGKYKLTQEKEIQMPANNIVLQFRKI